MFCKVVDTDTVCSWKNVAVAEHRVSLKTVPLCIFVHKFYKCWPIFLIFFSLSYSPWNLQRNPRPVSRHTLLLLLLRMQSNGDQRKNAKQSINQSINQFISSHTTDIHNLQNQSNENIKNDYKYLNIYDCQKFRNIHDIYRYKSLQSRMFNCSFYD